MRFVIRKAIRGDIAEIERVMRESLIGLGSLAYDQRQIASSLEHIAQTRRLRRPASPTSDSA